MLFVHTRADQAQKHRIYTGTGLLLLLLASFWVSGWLRHPSSAEDTEILPPAAKAPPPPPPPKDTLIVYAYHETDNARRNAEFFIRHGLHDSADFIIVINGADDHGLDKQLPPGANNIKFIRRDNTCYDIGSYGEVLRGLGDSLKKYKRFILLNSSIRGPFVPHWSKECWSEAYLGKLTDQVKLVGMSYNCAPFDRHVQSMILATDNVGMAVLLDPMAKILSECPNDWHSAVAVEVRLTGELKKAGYKADAMMQEFHGKSDFQDTCQGADRLWEGAYPNGQMNGPGSFVHPYETLFFKANRKVQEKLLGHLTTWTDAAGYSSYDACRDPRWPAKP